MRHHSCNRQPPGHDQQPLNPGTLSLLHGLVERTAGYGSIRGSYPDVNGLESLPPFPPSKTTVTILYTGSFWLILIHQFAGGSVTGSSNMEYSTSGIMVSSCRVGCAVVGPGWVWRYRLLFIGSVRAPCKEQTSCQNKDHEEITLLSDHSIRDPPAEMKVLS